MKKILILMSALAVVFIANCVMAEEVVVPTKTEQIMTTVSEKAEVTAEKTAESVKCGSKKAGKFIKEKSIIAGEKTMTHAKSGAKKAKRATVKGATQVSNVTAKGVKKAAEKVQNSAEKTIEKTDKKLIEMAPKCNCNNNCKCNNNCDCDKE